MKRFYSNINQWSADAHRRLPVIDRAEIENRRKNFHDCFFADLSEDFSGHDIDPEDAELYIQGKMSFEEFYAFLLQKSREVI